MEDEIERKLRLELKRTLKSEAQVCYALVLARKLLEQEPQDSEHEMPTTDSFTTLRFFCNWALHIKLTSARAGRLLQEFDSQVPAMLEGAHDNVSNLKSAKVFKMFDFMAEFMALLLKHGIAPESSTWAVKFINLYLGIISGCPVTYDGNRLELKYIDKLMVTRQPGDEVRFKWELSIRDHPVYSWDVEFPINPSALHSSSVLKAPDLAGP